MTKTAELTRLQVGDVSRHVNIIVSTIAEAEYLIDYLRDCTENGRVVNVRAFTSPMLSSG